MGLKPKKIYYGWLVVAASSGIGFANAATAIGILTIFVIPMSEEFGWNRTQVAGATSLGAILGAALAPFSGRLVDRRGSRALLTLGGLTVVLACGYLALAQTLAGFYIAFTVARIADQGLIKIGISPTIGKWFSKYRGRATGIVFFSEHVGMTLMAPLVQLVISGGRLAQRLVASGRRHAGAGSDPLRLANPPPARGPGIVAGWSTGFSARCTS